MKVWRSKEHAKYYLLGVYLSDGSVEDGYRFRLTQSGLENGGIVWITTSALCKLGISCTLRMGSPGSLNKLRYQILTYRSLESKDLIRWLAQYTRSKSILPQIPPHLLPEVLAGVLDGDGSIGCHRRDAVKGFHRSITWYGKSEYIQFLMSQLKILGVRFHGVHVPPGLTNFGKPHVPHWGINVQSFFSTGLFVRMPKKLDRLVEIAGSYTERIPQLIGEHWLTETLPLIPRSAKEYLVDLDLAWIHPKYRRAYSDLLERL